MNDRTVSTITTTPQNITTTTSLLPLDERGPYQTEYEALAASVNLPACATVIKATVNGSDGWWISYIHEENIGGLMNDGTKSTALLDILEWGPYSSGHEALEATDLPARACRVGMRNSVDGWYILYTITTTTTTLLPLEG